MMLANTMPNNVRKLSTQNQVLYARGILFSVRSQGCRTASRITRSRLVMNQPINFVAYMVTTANGASMMYRNNPPEFAIPPIANVARKPQTTLVPNRIFIE